MFTKRQVLILITLIVLLLLVWLVAFIVAGENARILNDTPGMIFQSHVVLGLIF